MLKKKKSRKEVVNPYYSLGLMHNVCNMIFQWCTKLKPPWVFLRNRSTKDFLSYQCILDSGCVYYPVKRASLVP